MMNQGYPQQGNMMNQGYPQQGNMMNQRCATTWYYE